MGILSKYPERIFFRLSTEDKEHLFNLADHLDLTVSNFVRQLVEKRLSRDKLFKNRSNKKDSDNGNED